MYKPKLEKEIRCPLEYGLDIFGGKWNSRIICVLAEKHTLRYSEIRKEMTDITDAVLAATLKNLISDNIVRREQYNEIPPKVEYSLTDKGESVIPILQSICKWSGAYHKNESEHVMAQCQKCDYNNE
ncbi:HTH-type transcriptional activator HxlR family protein [Clostridiales bacterium oral taxon 876 str. F0540]|nr:HTH-type transcriptional activator HxlR family protein [Clostridiales bacterium oral taxon 876 str. F0540]